MADSRRKTVLIVDDASLVRLYYRGALEQAGFAVEEALNGLEALEKLLTLRVDLIIVDVNMPQMDGLRFLERLRAKALPDGAVPALVTSTEGKSLDIAAARAAGANFYLVKPLSQETLVEHARLLSGAPR